MATPDRYIPPKEAARLLNLTPQSVSRKADNGEIEHVRDANGERRLLRSAVMKLVRQREGRRGKTKAR